MTVHRKTFHRIQFHAQDISGYFLDRTIHRKDISLNRIFHIDTIIDTLCFVLSSKYLIISYEMSISIKFLIHDFIYEMDIYIK